MHLDADEVVSYRTPGGGGYGAATTRDPQLVLADVLDERVSLARARDVYRVVIDMTQKCVDVAATQHLRQKST